jgi:hypothetical protein
MQRAGPTGSRRDSYGASMSCLTYSRLRTQLATDPGAAIHATDKHCTHGGTARSPDDDSEDRQDLHAGCHQLGRHRAGSAQGARALRRTGRNLVERYVFFKHTPDNDGAQLALANGSVRIATGLLGTRSGDTFTLATPTATIDIRGAIENGHR